MDAVYIFLICKSSTKEVFTIKFRELILEFSLFILGIYGTEIFDYMHTLIQKRNIQIFLFYVVLFVMLHMLLIDL